MTLMKYQKPNYLTKLFEDDEFFGFSPFNDLVRNFYGKDAGSGLVNVSETDTGYNLDFILPGYKKEDVKIEIDNNVLTVKADMKNEKDEKGKNFIRKEYVSSTFSRSFTLPEDASDEIKAEMSDGILKLSVDRLKEEKKKIKTISID